MRMMDVNNGKSQLFWNLEEAPKNMTGEGRALRAKIEPARYARVINGNREKMHINTLI